MLALALLPFVLPSPPAGGEDPPSTLALQRIETPAGGASQSPSLATQTGAGSVLSWLERGPMHETATLRLARWEATGWGPATTVASGDDWFVNWADVPEVALSADGTLVASWLVKSGAATYAYDALVAASSDGGASWSEPVRLHEDRSAAEHGFVSIVPLEERRFVAVWLDGRAQAAGGNEGGEHGHGGATALFARTLTLEPAKDALALGPEQLVDERVCDCCPTSLAGSATDGVVCLYRDRSSDEVRDIGFAFLGEEGWSAPGLVHADGWRIDGCPVNGPRIVQDGGRLAAVWFTGAGAGGGQVRAALSGRAGFEPPLAVDDGSPEGRVDACFLADGTLLVVWLEHEPGGASWRLRRLHRDGGRLVREASLVVAEVSGSRASGRARLAPTADGQGALLVWTEGTGATATLASARVTTR